MNEQDIQQIRQYIIELPLPDDQKNGLLRQLDEQGPNADLLNKIGDAITNRHNQDTSGYLDELGKLNSDLDQSESDLKQAEQEFELDYKAGEQEANTILQQANSDIDQVELEITREELQ